MNKTTQPQGNKTPCDKDVREVNCSSNCTEFRLKTPTVWILLQRQKPQGIQYLSHLFWYTQPIGNEDHNHFSSIPGNVKLGISKPSQPRCVASSFLPECSPRHTGKRKDNAASTAHSHVALFRTPSQNKTIPMSYFDNTAASHLHTLPPYWYRAPSCNVHVNKSHRPPLLRAVQYPYCIRTVHTMCTRSWQTRADQLTHQCCKEGWHRIRSWMVSNYLCYSNAQSSYYFCTESYENC